MSTFPRRQYFSKADCIVMRLGRIAVFLALAPSYALFGQPMPGSVQGTVTDTAGRPLEGVEISVGRTGVLTNPQGFFRVEGLPAGEYALAARMVGYTSVRIPFTISPDRPTELVIGLAPSAYSLPEVVVESRRTGIYGAVFGSLFHPLMGATAQIFGPTREAALTDSAGRFAFAAARAGPYLVRVSAKGHGERRVFVDVSKGGGRELRFRLSASRAARAKDEETALSELGLRLSADLRTERLTAAQLERYQSLGLCDVPQLRERIGRRGYYTTLVINGSRVIKDFPVLALCTWRADEVALVEFDIDPCRDVTNTIAPLIYPGGWCFARARAVRRSIGGSSQPISAQASGGSYVIIWEKR